MDRAERKESVNCRWMDAAPAILNAIENATGVSFNHVPLMPEAMMEKLSISKVKREQATVPSERRCYEGSAEYQ